MFNLQEIKIGDIVRVHTVVDPAIGIVKEIAKGKDYGANVGNMPHWDYSVWGWRKESVYRIEVSSPIKIMTEYLWNWHFANQIGPYTICTTTTDMWLPKKCVKKY